MNYVVGTLPNGTPEKCPVTGMPFFMMIRLPGRNGRYVPTYGGPFDSYTIPEQSEDGDWYRHHFCHDRGAWVDIEWFDHSSKEGD